MSLRKASSCVTLFLLFVLTAALHAQTSYTSQVRGQVSDQSGAVVPDATVTITNDATGIALTAKTDDTGLFNLSGLRPATYTVRVEKSGFQRVETKNVVLAVDQQATLNFALKPAGISESVEVTTAPPLLETESAAIGTDVTNEYVRDIPLYNRSFFGLVFLAGGVSEVTGAGTTDNYPAGTNFVSNGQRNATAEIRLDGALTSAPEQGEGATTNVYYQPTVESVQEFKVQNNSFSSEYGNNGGTVVNIVMKSGTNKYHGSGWWYGQRSALDARDFFNDGDKPDHTRDQYGFALGGPIVKNRTFFFVDYERTRLKDPVNITANVPTLDERQGNFSASGPIYNPNVCVPNGGSCDRPRFNFNGNDDVIDPLLWDPIGQQLINLYPEPNSNDPGANFRAVTLANAPSYQWDAKIDHQLTANSKIAGRYSDLHNEYVVPVIFANDEFGDGVNYTTDVHNIGLEYTWNMRPTLLWSNHFAVDRVVGPGRSDLPDPTSVGFPSILTRDNGISRMPAILTDNPDNFAQLYSGCCVDTNFAHSLYSYSSSMQWIKGRHSLKFGGEQRHFYNNFWQPQYPTGSFTFGQDITSQHPSTTVGGNTFAGILLGWGDFGGIGITPAVADKSKETAFYFQDDIKITPRLTVNLGLRYEWSTPYSERFNREQFSDFSGDTGINIPGLGEIRGTTVFAGSGNERNAPVDRNNWAPRLGFAYSPTNNTVIRGGFGVYYGLNVATNFQLAGTAFRKDGVVHFSTNDDQVTRNAFLSDPFPQGLAPAQGTAYGKLAEWGFSNGNDLGTDTARNAEIYQFNIGVQKLLPGQIVVAADYSANRSTHLPWGGYSSTRNRNFLSSAVRNQVSAQQHALDPLCDDNSCVSNFLSGPAANPFQCFFQVVGSPGAYCPTSPIFNEPDSVYNGDTISQGNLLRPYPQFDGGFEGLPLLAASSWYHSLQLRFQKRVTHGISFEGNYTLSKATDDSSAGANAFVGNLNAGNPQELDNLKAEHAIGANDATHRITGAVIMDIPIGRGRWIGRDVNRIVDGIIGGWSLSTVFTLQSGQPLAIGMVNPRLMDGNQRPNVVCDPSAGITSHKAASTGQPFLNIDCFADPGDQQAGDAPRYFSNLRGDGVHNLDISLSKDFVPHEGMTLQVRAEFFNFTNTPRFAFPDTLWDPTNDHFGVVDSTASGSNPRRMQIGVRFEF